MKFCFLFISFVFICSDVFGATIHLDFEEAARLSLSGNPDLVTLRAQEEAIKFRARQALAPNSPTVSVNKNDLINPSPLASSASTVLGMNFVLGFPGKAFAMNSQLNNQSQSFREQSLAKEIQLLMSLSDIYISVFVNKKIQEFLTDELEKAKNTVQLTEKKYSLAQAQQSEVLNIRVAAINLEHEVLVAKDEYATLVSQFRNLIKRPASKEIEPRVPDKIEVPEIQYTPEQLNEILLRNKQSLKAAIYQKQAAESAVNQAALSPFPDIQLNGSMNLYHLASAQSIEGVNRTYSVGVALTVPIFFPLNELSGIQAARKDRDAAEQQEESQRLSAIADLQALLVKFDGARRQKKSLETYVLPAAKASYDLTLKGYTLGRVDYLKLNDARETWIASQKNYFQKMLEVAHLYNQITQHIGCELSRSSMKEGPHACI